MARAWEGPAAIFGERVEVDADDHDVIGYPRVLFGIDGAFLDRLALLGELEPEIRVIVLELDGPEQAGPVAQREDDSDDDGGDHEAEGSRLEEFRALLGHVPALLYIKKARNSSGPWATATSSGRWDFRKSIRSVASFVQSSSGQVETIF